MPVPASAPRSRLFMQHHSTPERVLLVRCAMLFVLVSTVLAIFWFDRDGLRDQTDGHISFSDVAYFTAVTISTVGYGDIVPVSDRARLVDAVLVTPLRLVIWLIFLGTAYELVLQHWLENWRMRRLHDKLDQHVIICGYGHGGQSAAREAVARGMDPRQIIVIDRNGGLLSQACEDGFVGLHGDATREQDLSAACATRAKSIIICLGHDDATVLCVLTLRQLNSKARVICSISEEENIKLVRQAGADAIVAPSIVGGYLMADSIDSQFVADYISDLMCSEGRVRLWERVARADEVGRRMRDLSPEMVVRLHRGDEKIGFWEGDRSIIRAGDILLTIQPNPPGDA